MTCKQQRPLLLALVLAAAPLFAQQAPQQQDEEAVSPPTVDGPAPAAGDKEPPVAAETDNDSPFDYRSSEEISEDLSVSFPVDI